MNQSNCHEFSVGVVAFAVVHISLEITFNLKKTISRLSKAVHNRYFLYAIHTQVNLCKEHNLNPKCYWEPYDKDQFSLKFMYRGQKRGKY